MKVDFPRKNTDRWLMSNDQQPVVSGLLSLPRSVPGTVSLFERQGATWTLQREVPDDSNHRIGSSIAVSGDWMVIGSDRKSVV